jgi:hypothetical protein
MPKSIYSEPMPSPNGTNYERLYIVRKPFAEAMALDAAMPKYGSGDNGDPDDIDINETDNEGYDLEDKIRQLLEGKLDDADVEMLIKLIQPDNDAPAPAQDKRRRMGRDQRLVMPSKAEILRRIAVSGEVRAQRAQKQYTDLCQRFPALKSARVA